MRPREKALAIAALALRGHIGLVASDLAAGKNSASGFGLSRGTCEEKAQWRDLRVRLELPGTSGQHLELSARRRPFDRTGRH